jgi:hypothetical protein
VGQLSASLVLSLSGRVEHPLDVPIECPQHADPRVHQEVAAFDGADQAGLTAGLLVCPVLRSPSHIFYKQLCKPIIERPDLLQYLSLAAVV